MLVMAAVVVASVTSLGEVVAMAKIWKANRFWVLVADWVFRKVRGIPAEVEEKLTVMVVVAKETEEEACS